MDLNEQAEEDINVEERNEVVRGWSRYATKMLIAAYGEYRSIQNDPKQRKNFWNNIQEYLTTHGINFPVKKIQNKWRNLKQLYSTSKLVMAQSGSSFTKFEFFKEMDEILGSKPVHTTVGINVGASNFASNSFDFLNVYTSPTPHTPEPEPDEQQSDEAVVIEVVPDTITNIRSSRRKRRKRNTVGEDMVELKREEISMKKKYYGEKLTLLRQQHTEKMADINRIISDSHQYAPRTEMNHNLALTTSSLSTVVHVNPTEYAEYPNDENYNPISPTASTSKTTTEPVHCHPIRHLHSITSLSPLTRDKQNTYQNDNEVSVSLTPKTSTPKSNKCVAFAHLQISPIRPTSEPGGSQTNKVSLGIVDLFESEEFLVGNDSSSFE